MAVVSTTTVYRGLKAFSNARTHPRSLILGLDGSDVEDLLGFGLDEPIGIALDVSAGKMYWTDLLADRIQRANLDGSSVEDVITGLPIPCALALDVSGGKMYWTERVALFTARIRRANLDGSAVENLVESGIDFPSGIALDVVAGKMYWTDSREDRIQRANLDGSDVETLVTGQVNLQGIAVDSGAGWMYWVDFSAGSIRRSRLDGSDIVTLRAGLGQPDGIALDLRIPGTDCQPNGNRDACDIAEGLSEDCNLNAIPDECEADCNDNGVTDSCDIAGGLSSDCNGNGTPDDCEPDCNGNAVADSCDLTSGTSPDVNANSIPDECEARTPQVQAEGCRYVAVTPETPAAIVSQAFLITSPDYPCLSKYIRADGGLGMNPVFQTAEQWRTIHVFGSDITPSSTYVVVAESTAGTTSAPRSVTTSSWGDVAGAFESERWAPPDGELSFMDVVAALDGFAASSGAPPFGAADVHPQMPNQIVDIVDVVMVLDAFRGLPYPFAGPQPCP